KAAVTVTGDVEGGSGYNAIYAQGQSAVSVDGNVYGGSGIKDDVDFSNPQAYSDGGDGVVAADQATVTVTGNAAGGDAYGTYGYGGNGVEAYDEAKVFVGGDVKGGGVSADPGTSATVDGSTYSSVGGHGIEMESTAAVTVGGNVYGGSTNGDQGSGGSGVMMYMVMAPTEEEADEIAGELIVTGDVKEGKGAENTEYPGAGIMFHIYGHEEGDVPVEASISVRSVSSINAYDENTGEYDPEMAEKLAETITYTAKTEADSTPDTGDGSHPMLFGILAAAAVLGMGIVLKGKCRSKA
ncbi:MAG: hypothetical protein IIY16_03655, partial [Oscillospiraceae bacterium]|nr:hypothetical protein [Oscillospiraceae bacterium]